MPKVSIYPHIREVENGAEVELVDVFHHIKNGFWEQEVNILRKMVLDGKPEKEIETYKNGLPYFTGSGTFSKRNLAGLIEHSGKLVVDFDKVEETMTMEKARGLLLNDQYTEYLFLSCTGRGFAAIVNINPKAHLDSFFFLEKYYKTRYGLKMDKSCKDIPRPRYISYDPDLFHNPNAVPVVHKDQEKIFAPVGISFDDSISIDTDEGKYQWCKAVHEKKEAYVTGNRHNYITIFSFFLNKAGVTHSYALNTILSEFANNEKTPDELTKIVNYAYQRGLDEFGTFRINKSYQDMPPEYVKSTKDIYKQAHSINRAGREWEESDIKSFSKQYDLSPDIVRNIFKSVFKKNQDEFGIDHKPDIYKVENFIKKKWEIVKNEVTRRIEGREIGKDELSLINVDQINRELMHHKFKFPLDKLKSLLRSDFVPIYNPFKKYFHSLPEWDGQDHIDDLANHVQTTNQEFWRTQFKKALVRNIACSVDLRVNRIIMTLVCSEEENGKSSFIRFLCPPALKDYYSESNLDNSKDSEIQLSENFIQNIEELAALNAIDINRFKSIISKSSIKQRRAYGEFSEVIPRRVNFWASTNKEDFLTDDQNTRWLCFTVKSINFDYNNTVTGVRMIDINKVWAQAWHLYNNDFNYHLTTAEILARQENNRSFESSSFEKELIMSKLKPAVEPFGEFMANSDIMIFLSELVDNKHKINIYSISRAMAQLGFQKGVKKFGGKPCRGWWVQQISLLDEKGVVMPRSKPL